MLKSSSLKRCQQAGAAEYAIYTQRASGSIDLVAEAVGKPSLGQNGKEQLTR